MLLVAVSCSPDPVPDIPLYDNLARYHFKVTTGTQGTQDYFDQGFVLYYGFNHEAAITSFREAVRLDSSCAMAWWGQAISAGPNINNPYMDSVAVKTAWDAVQKAVSLKAGASAFEQDLIDALSNRYAWPQPEDRKSLDVAYADAMREIWKKYPGNVDAGALFADAMLNLRPWDLWTPEGEARPETPEIVATLERLLEMDPRHPGACHFYIHTMEASPWPERALAAADSLRYRIPGAGHLVHMPSHIYIRLGQYDEAVKANRRGVAADSQWIPYGGFYTLYRAHNYHFLAYAAMFDGQKEVALKAARETVEQIPLELVRQFPDFLDGFLAVPTHVLVRFGLWEEMLKEPRPPADLYVTTAFWRYGRSVAFSATGRVKEAAAELDSFRAAFARVPNSRTIGNNGARTVLEIGLSMAEGELEYRRGRYERAFKLLRAGVEGDDALRYDEPWGWMMPVRHSLGALLIDQGRFKEAENVYRKDLEIHKNNGWALKGLAMCQHLTNQHDEAAKTDELFKTAWARSDITLKASCFCSEKAAM